MCSGHFLLVGQLWLVFWISAETLHPLFFFFFFFSLDFFNYYISIMFFLLYIFFLPRNRSFFNFFSSLTSLSSLSFTHSLYLSFMCFFSSHPYNISSLSLSTFYKTNTLFVLPWLKFQWILKRSDHFSPTHIWILAEIIHLFGVFFFPLNFFYSHQFFMQK